MDDDTNGYDEEQIMIEILKSVSQEYNRKKKPSWDERDEMQYHLRLKGRMEEGRLFVSYEDIGPNKYQYMEAERIQFVSL